jgi:4,5-dihydroxyphthalate decarboxylase
MRTYAGMLAIQRFDRTEALHDGRVTIDRVMVCQVLPAAGVRGVLDGAFAAAEMPLAHYLFLRDRGDPFTAIPVFPDRLCLQHYAFTTRSSGISSPADLAGRRVAVPMYYMTSSVWHRGFLEDETGLTAADLSWVCAATERDPRMAPPAGVRVRLVPAPHLGLELLLRGEADALLTEATPVVPASAADTVVPIHPDPDRAARDFFARTGVHPIVHVIVLRREFAAEHPELVWEICRGFDRAKESAYRLLQNERITSLPFMRAHLDETVRGFGADPWPYGLTGRNRAELDRFLGYAHRQGLTRTRWRVDELFDNPGRDYPWSARMVRGADLAGMASLRGLPEPAPREGGDG